jgi:NAD(P)-dependent dehydrogenase (short-subunit alcohol dehydrogenase family)
VVSMNYNIISNTIVLSRVTGIGAMMARALDANGASKVYIIGRRFDKLEEVAAQAINKTIIPIKGDVSVKESLAECAARVAKETPFVNVVIANSGSQGPTVNELPTDRELTLAEFHEFLWKPTYPEFNEAFEINSTAMFFTMVAFLPLLDAGNNHESSPTVKTGVKSQFIITGSISSMSRRPKMGFAYSASKAAANLMMKQISTMMVPYHIRANIINPGIYPSDMSAVSFQKQRTH